MYTISSVFERRTVGWRSIPGTTPATSQLRLAHLDHCDQCCVLFESDEGSAQVVPAIQCSATFNGSTATWSYALNRAETQYRLGGEARSSAVKWEGSALLVNTLVSGLQSYTLMDRWELSRDRSRLTITRQVVRGPSQREGTLVFKREGQPTPLISANARTRRGAQPARAASGAPPQITVAAGTHIPLTLRNVSTPSIREKATASIWRRPSPSR